MEWFLDFLSINILLILQNFVKFHEKFLDFLQFFFNEWIYNFLTLIDFITINWGYINVNLSQLILIFQLNVLNQ